MKTWPCRKKNSEKTSVSLNEYYEFIQININYLVANHCVRFLSSVIVVMDSFSRIHEGKCLTKKLIYSLALLRL